MENSLPKLKELLEQQGMQLADSDVKQQSDNQAEQEEAQNGAGGLSEQDAAELELQEAQQAAAHLTVNSPYTVDYFA